MEKNISSVIVLTVNPQVGSEFCQKYSIGPTRGYQYAGRAIVTGPQENTRHIKMAETRKPGMNMYTVSWPLSLVVNRLN